MGFFSKSPKPAPAAKKFIPPEAVDFDATWKFMLHLAAVGNHYDDTAGIYIRANANGTVHLNVRGIVVGMNYLRTKYPVICQHYNGSTTLNFDFRPDYPVHEWEQYVFEDDLRNCALNGYVHRCAKSSDGSLDVVIRFRDNSGSAYLENAEAFDRLLNNTYYR